MKLIHFALIILLLVFINSINAKQSNYVEICQKSIQLGDYKKALILCGDQLVNAKKSQDKNSEIELYLLLIDVNHTLGNLKEQDDFLEKLNKHILFQENPKFQFHWNRWQGRKYFHLNDNNLCKQYLYQSLSIATIHENQQWLMMSYNDVGLIEKKLGNYKIALNHFKKSLELKRKRGTLYQVGKSLNNIAVLYFKLEEFNTAIDYFNQALKSYDDYQHTKNYDKRVQQSISHTYEYLLEIYTETNKKKSIEEYYNNLVFNFNKNSNPNIKSRTLISIARYYKDHEEYQLAKIYLQNAIELGDSKNNNLTALIYNELSQIYIKLGNSKEALIHVLKSLELAKLNGEDKLVADNYLLVSQLNKKSNISTAFQALKKYQILREQFLKKKYNTDLKTLQFEFEKQQIERNLLEQKVLNIGHQANIHRLTIILLLAFIALVLTMIFFIYFTKKKKTEKIKLLASINYHKKQLQFLEQDNSKTNNSIKNALNAKLRLNESLVLAMVDAISIWEQYTKTNKVELAEKSKVWTVSIDNGNLRTRSLDKYLDINKIPQNPRWRFVVRTCHFVLANETLLKEDRDNLEQRLNQVMINVKKLSLSSE